MKALTRVATAALYQTTLAIGIVLMPVAVLARQLGVTLPLRRVIERTEEAYERTR